MIPNISKAQHQLVNDMARVGIAVARQGGDWRAAMANRYPGVEIGLHCYAETVVLGVIEGRLAESKIV